MRRDGDGCGMGVAAAAMAQQSAPLQGLVIG